jgi:hypothetical protein
VAKPLGAPLDQPVGLVRREVHQQALSRDEHARRVVDLVHPARVEDRAAHLPEPGVLREKPPPQSDHLRKVDRDPADLPVVDAPELRLQPLAECGNCPGGMRAEELPDCRVERTRAQRLPLREGLTGAEALPEREVDPLHELDGHRVSKHRVRAPRLDGTVVERPEKGLGHPLELDRNGAHDRATHASTL